MSWFVPNGKLPDRTCLGPARVGSDITWRAEFFVPSGSNTGDRVRLKLELEIDQFDVDNNDTLYAATVAAITQWLASTKVP